VVANYPDGTQKVVFNTTEPHLVENEMSELIDWTVMHLKSGKIHPLVVTGLFIYEFLSIHPFQDGNGRLSRLLTNLLLLQSGYRFVSYVSLIYTCHLNAGISGNRGVILVDLHDLIELLRW